MGKTRKSNKTKTKNNTKTRKSHQTNTKTKTNVKTKTNTKIKIKKKVELKGKNLQLFVGSKEQTSKLAWVTISDGLIYISRDNNRIYWLIRKMKKDQLPKITFNDKKQTVKVGNNKIVIKKENDYQSSKALIEPYL